MEIINPTDDWTDCPRCGQRAENRETSEGVIQVSCPHCGYEHEFEAIVVFGDSAVSFYDWDTLSEWRERGCPYALISIVDSEEEAEGVVAELEKRENKRR